jgi:hypothetical protein
LRLPRSLGARAWWLGLLLWPAFGGCDLFSFPEPVRKSSFVAAAAGAAGAPEQTFHVLGDPCVPTPNEASCGVDEHGTAMTCFRGTSLAGEDFCAPSCSPADEQDPAQVCTAEGALLPACHPHLPDPAADCPDGLNCYRLSLFDDKGVCIKMPVCSSNSDCTDPVHGTCTAQVIKSLIGAAAALLPLDHLNCARTSCVALSTTCPSNEGCLGNVYDAQIADICTPNCDANLHCPPNYSCAVATSGSGAAKLCLPGMPGFRCDGPHCVGGTCDDTGAGFSVCSRACDLTSDCELINTESDAFFCVDGVDGAAGKHCVTPRPYHGANCLRDEQCKTDLDEFCSEYDTLGPNAQPGECRVHCKPDGTCEPRGGLPHTCLWGGNGGCFPGQQGLPCKLDSECFEGLKCQDVPAEVDPVTAAARICTRPCGGKRVTEADADAECAAPRSVNGGGYCADGLCRAQHAGGQGCSRNAQCTSNLCDTTKKTCVPKPATAPPQ